MKKLFRRLTFKSDRQRGPNLLSVLEILLCSDHLLSLLPVNDLLRLRRVCKSSKKIIEEFIKTQKVKTHREFEFKVGKSHTNSVGYSTKCQNSCNSLPIPTHVRFSHFTTKDKSLFSCETVQDFIQNCGATITHLSIGYFQVPLDNQRLLNFFQSFPNVSHLELNVVGPFETDEDGDNDNLSSADGGGESPSLSSQVVIPPSLQQLKSLRILSSSDTENTVFFVITLVEGCVSNLETLSLPFEQLMFGTMLREPVIRLACALLFNFPNLKLEHVHGELFDELLNTDNRTPEMGTLFDMIDSINSKVVSIRSPQTTSCIRHFNDLEEIDFKRTLGFVFLDLKVTRKEWPSLKKISATFDDVPKFSQLWEFLFGGGIKGENVSWVDIKFYGFGSLLCSDDLRRVDQTIKRTWNLWKAFPNVKILHFGSHSYDQLIILSRLWRGLPLLEEVRFRRCKHLYDDDFIGEVEAEPAFWDLKFLKLLELEFVDEDGIQVTDELFSHVLCHMPLKTLSLSSEYPTRITLKGIGSLLLGKFADTIERFSIEGLQIEGANDGQKKSVENLFRSSQMV